MLRVLRRAALGLTAVVAFGVWLWGAAVRAAPEVRRRKAAARSRRRAPGA